jgi:hypothetical protein
MKKYVGHQLRTRLSNAVANQFIADFSANGGEVIAKLRHEKPLEYIKMMTAILEQAQAATEAAPTPTYTVIERRVVRPDNPNG